MFHAIRPAVLDRMRYLEKLERKNREDGMTRLRHIRRVPSEMGKLLNLLAVGD